ncbi:MAG TPA: FAD-dependent oxidoreductase, partial [Bacteroidia bacterium]|nr:FAD-dependent oxidoreductase [Bacteroidia bacterium]
TLPFQLSKGEIIEVYCEHLHSSYILNRNNFVLPISDNLFKVGATYQWQYLNNQPSIEARMHLAQMLKQITHLPFEITNHWAAIRPTIKDRRPVVRWQQKNVGIINGLGTKGVLLAPLMARQLIDNLPAN